MSSIVNSRKWSRANEQTYIVLVNPIVIIFLESTIQDVPSKTNLRGRFIYKGVLTVKCWNNRTVRVVSATAKIAHTTFVGGVLSKCYTCHILWSASSLKHFHSALLIYWPRHFHVHKYVTHIHGLLLLFSYIYKIIHSRAYVYNNFHGNSGANRLNDLSQTDWVIEDEVKHLTAYPYYGRTFSPIALCYSFTHVYEPLLSLPPATITIEAKCMDRNGHCRKWSWHSVIITQTVESEKMCTRFCCASICYALAFHDAMWEILSYTYGYLATTEPTVGLPKYELHVCSLGPLSLT